MDAPAILHGCLSLLAGARKLALETSWDLPSGEGATSLLEPSLTEWMRRTANR